MPPPARSSFIFRLGSEGAKKMERNLEISQRRGEGLVDSRERDSLVLVESNTFRA